MSQVNFQLPQGCTPAYLRIADAIRRAICQQQLAPLEKLPSSRRLAEQFQLSRQTVMAALAELCAEGWLLNRERSGYFVCAAVPIIKSQSKKPALVSTQAKLKTWSLAMPKRPFELDSNTYKFNFMGGLPDLNNFPSQEFKRFINRALNQGKSELLGYANPQGRGDFRAQLAIYLRRMRNIQTRSLLVTNGAQEAIYMIAQLLLSIGDRVAVEGLCYPPACQALQSSGAQLVTIQQDDQGLDPDHLESQLKHQRIKLLYLTPLHQYPTTVTLNVARRQRIYQLAQQYDFAILEDDYDHEFHYACQPLPPMASQDPDQRVIYLSSLSKVLFPASRIGFLALPDALLSPLLTLKKMINQQSSNLMQLAIALWMQDGGFERHLRRSTRRYKQRLENTCEQIERANIQGKTLRFNRPQGGMALWLDLGQDSKSIAQAAKQQGIYLQYQQQLDVTGQPGSHVRLGFAGNNEDIQNEGLARLFSLLK